MCKSGVAPEMLPETVPVYGPLGAPVASAHPPAFGPIALKRTVSPLDWLSEKFPGKPHWLQLGVACAGAGTVSNATAPNIIAAPTNLDLFAVVASGMGVLSIGSPC